MMKQRSDEGGHEVSAGHGRCTLTPAKSRHPASLVQAVADGHVDERAWATPASSALAIQPRSSTLFERPQMRVDIGKTLRVMIRKARLHE